MLASLLALAGCGGSDDEALVVFAASSLSGIADAIDPDAEVIFGGSNDLAAQIRDGAKVDIFLSASGKPVEDLRTAGFVDSFGPFASNRLVIVVPASNPAQIESLRDLDRTGVKLVLGAEGVPAGDYARQALASAGEDGALARVVSLEDDVKGVLGKVALGEADAGIVYATDAGAAGDDVRTVPIPARFQPAIRYYVAILRPGSERARKYVIRLTGAEGRMILRVAGFLPPPS